MKKTMLACAILSFVIMLTVPVSAQEGEPGADRKADPIRFSLGLRADWTDNRDAIETRNESTWDLYIQPRVDAVIEGERSLLDFFYVPSFRYRTDPSDIQNDTEWHHDLGLVAKHSPSPRVNLRLNEKFDYTDDPSVQATGSTVRRDRTFLLNRAEGGLNYEINRKTTADFFARNIIKRYDEEVVATESDEDRTDLRFVAWRQVARTLALTATARYSMFAYESRIGIQRDFDSVVGALGIDKVISKNLRGSLMGGVQAQEYDDAGLDSDTTPYVEARLTCTTSPATRIFAIASHGTRDADVFPYASQEFTQGSLELEWDPSARITLGLIGLYRVGDYAEEATPSSAPALAFAEDRTGEENTLVGEGRIKYKILANSYIKLSHKYEDVDSDVSESYSVNTTSLVLSRQF